MRFLLLQSIPGRFRIVEARGEETLKEVKQRVKLEAETMARESGNEVTVWEYVARTALELSLGAVWPEVKSEMKKEEAR